MAIIPLPELSMFRYLADMTEEQEVEIQIAGSPVATLEVPEGKKWTVIVKVNISETDA